MLLYLYSVFFIRFLVHPYILFRHFLFQKNTTMKKSIEIEKLIIKYAILLAIIYALQYALLFFLNSGFELKTLSNDAPVLSFIPQFITLLFSFVTLFFIWKDSRRMQIKNKYLLLLTLLFRPLGVCIFLLEAALHNSVGVVENE
mgnify:CR=1 FL=1